MSLNEYQQIRNTRSEPRHEVGTFRGGKLAPVMAVPFLGAESGIVNQVVHLELDPIAGRMITEITAEIVSVFVPAQAADALKNPEEDFAGSSEVFRQKMVSGAPVFGLEDETEVSKRLGVIPRSISGEKKVNEIARLSHNVAVNYLRRRKFVDALQLDKNSTAMTPALLGQTVLKRLNGVLDPEDRLNGQVMFETPELNLPVHFKHKDTTSMPGFGLVASSNTQRSGDGGGGFVDPQIFAEFAASSNGISLKDFYEAEHQDSLTRKMRQLVDDNPEFGEDMLNYWVHGLSVNTGKLPFVVYQQSHAFGSGVVRGMDGASLDVLQSNHAETLQFTAPIPASEFGGVLITFVSVKPDEALAAQPHPILSTEWGARNHVADELAIDPVPVTIRDLYADCAVADEATVALYVGNNGLLKTYMSYGFNRNLNKNTVANKSAIWQLEVPMSVTPESVIYPEDLDHYPFSDQEAEVVRYNVSSNCQIQSPIIFGPTPIEELAVIDSSDLFEETEE